MGTQEIIGLAITIAVLAGAALYFAVRLKKKKAFEYNNEVVPFAVGNSTIYLRRFEIPHFESLGRSERRRIVSKFDAEVKRGNMIPVREKGKIVGFKRK